MNFLVVTLFYGFNYKHTAFFTVNVYSHSVAWKLQGRDEGAVIEDWEDPDLSIYKSTDRYGFMQ